MTAPTASSAIARILVVDDTPDNLFLMNGLFEDHYVVMQAGSGRQALEAIMSATPPDIVLLDIMMPDMDGYEVLRRIRQHPPTANIPVVFLTALDSTQDQLLGLDLGAVDYLTKPVDPAKAFARVEAHLASAVRARRMEALSEKLARHLAPSEWESLFHGPAQGGISFEHLPLTVLYADASDGSAWARRGYDGFAEDVERLAAQHAGTVDPFVDQATVVYFGDASQAVKMAIALQGLTADLRLRMGLHSGMIELSTFGGGLDVRRTLIGPEAGLAAKVAVAASTGGIMLSPDTLALVGDEVHVDSTGHLIAQVWGDSMPGPLPALSVSGQRGPVRVPVRR